MFEIRITGLADFIERTNGKDESYLLLYKSGTETSDCAHRNLVKVAGELTEIEVYSADINEVKDIHQQYNITSVPSLLEFKSGEFKNVIKGCHDESFYKSLFENAVYHAKAKKEGKTTKTVVVYSTPNCSWCTTLKSYLRKNNIRFAEIDVSKNEEAADRMRRKSGQTGVPQTEINGQIVVGFDKMKINQLLEIQ